MTHIVLIAHNLRSTHNVGSLLRTCDGLGVRVYLTGYTPYPSVKNDARLPHLQQRITKQISKTALGAEKTGKWNHNDKVSDVVTQLRNDGYAIVSLEQSKNAIKLPSYSPPEKIAIIVGREVEGIETEILALSDCILEFPMYGKK